MYLMPDEKKTILYYALLPEDKGSVTLESGVSYSSDGIWRDYGSYPLDLSVTNEAADIIDMVSLELGNLHPLTNQENADVAAARNSLEKVPKQANYTVVELDSIIHELLKAIDAIIDIRSVNTDQVRKDLDKLLAIFAAKWYQLQ